MSPFLSWLLPNVPPEPPSNRSEVYVLAEQLKSKVSALPTPLLALATLAVGSAATLSSVYIYTRLLKRIPNSDWVTPNILAERRWVKGFVTSVGDADNFRIYHTPGFGWRWPLKLRRIPVGSKDLKDQTIHIRLAGVDAPEAAHFGRPAQKYSEESLLWLKNYVEGKTVYCQLIRRDQYGRIVAMAYLKPWILPGFMFTGKCISVEMLRAGWVRTYEQAGAEYGKWGKEEFLRLEAEARRARRGQWKYGGGGETPAEYKRRYAGVAEAPAAPVKKARRAPGVGWLRRLWPNR